ncbi:hypothetical protein B566_EDAN010631 [Ephemera danica]|nr:hypothetical protein B566_EDAN010631 [Ephemera danica]
MVVLLLLLLLIDGRLQEGDQILAIDGQPLDADISHQQAISILQQARGLVELVIARQKQPRGDASSLSGPAAASAAAATTAQQPELATSPLLNTEWAQVEVIDLVNDGSGLGFGIIGGRSTGVVVKTILPGGVADRAVEVLRATGQTVRLRLERYLRGPKFEQLQQAIANSELKPPTPSSPSITSLAHIPISTDGETETEVEPEGESRTTIDSLVLLESGIGLDLSGSPLDATNTLVALAGVECLIDQHFEGELSPATEDALQAKWAQIMGPDTEIVVAQLSKQVEGGGLGISLEGTVDVEDGQEVRPHHYIRSILPDGPVGRNGRLHSGDELLEDLPLHVRMVCARKPGEVAARLIDTSQDRAAFAARSVSSLFTVKLASISWFLLHDETQHSSCSQNILGGSLQNLIPASDRLVKAKSDGSLASSATAGTDSSFSRMKSRSLEPLTGLAMWSSEPQVIELVKGDRGLGFSILDYQDPMNPSETVIVIRSLVPGGVAQQDGRLIPGDRLLFVNNTSLENASLDRAVQALKGAQRGIVRIGVAKPLPLPDSAASASSPSQVSEQPEHPMTLPSPPPLPPTPMPRTSPPSYTSWLTVDSAADAASAALVKSESF